MDSYLCVEDELLDNLSHGVPLIGYVGIKEQAELVKEAASTRGLSIVEYASNVFILVQSNDIH